jgi:hypothetical protein
VPFNSCYGDEKSLAALLVEIHLVIAGSDGREVAEAQYLRKEDHQLMVIF